MITHVVFFKLVTPNQETAQTIKSKLMALPKRIPQIKHYEVGINVIESARNYDLALISQFDTLEDLNTYQAHPEHQEVVNYIKSVTSSIIAVDYDS
ncbi:MAG: Dabb family protein [Chloroflexi bacterium]|nr:MAG: Dabb family protein [Chloroflexota bacterium]